MKTIENSAEASTEIKDALDAAEASEKFMVVVFRVEGADEVTMNRITYQFPHRLIEQASKMLAIDLRDELRPPVQQLAEGDVSHLLRRGEN